MTKERRDKIISLVISTLIGLAAGIAGIYGIEVLASCTTTGSADWDMQITPLEASNEQV